MFIILQTWDKEMLESRTRFEPFTNLVPRVSPGKEVRWPFTSQVQFTPLTIELQSLMVSELSYVQD